MAFKFPFTNYHELNLNWVLEELKKLFEDSEENVSTIETYDERLIAVETELPTVSATAQDAAQNAAAASTAAQQATATANTAQENATQAQSLAGFARQEAQAAQTAADAATQAAQQATATAQNFDGRITQAQNDASTALEASHSFENRVQAAITTANNAANTATNAQGIAIRADQNAALALDTLNAQRAELERIGAEQAALITAETEDKKTEIENLAESVLDSIPADYTTLSNLVDKKAPVIINTASGSIASFNDGADNMKIQKLVVNIEPVQAGSGDPSPDNVRPISGWTGAEIGNSAKNMFSTEFEQGGIDTANGAKVNSTVRIRSKDLILLKPGTYTFSCKESSTMTAMVCIYNNQKEYVKPYGSVPGTPLFLGIPYTFTLDADSYVYIVATISSSTTVNPESISEVQLELGSTATAYEPYTGDQISVTFPSEAGTVYGGALTLNPDRTGALVVDMATADMGTLNWVYQDNKYFRAPFPNGAEISGYGSNDFLCEIYRYGTGPDIFNQTADKVMTLNSSYLVGQAKFACVRDSTYTDAASFKTAVTGKQLCYPLVSPQTCTLTASEVSGILTTLYGQNNILADTGSVSVDYPADTKLYIDGKLAELQATILENI